MKQNPQRTLRKLGRAALFSAVRAIAATVGAGIPTAIIWACHH